MLNEGAADCLLPMAKKGSGDDVIDNLPPPSHYQPPHPDKLVKKWTERVDRCLEQQWKDSQHLLSYAKALKDSGGAIINSDDIVKELSGLGFTMMQKSIDLRQEIVNESYNTDFFDCHIKKPNNFQYHHYNSQPHSSSSQLLPNHQYAYSRPTSVGVLNSPRQKCSSSFYLPFSSQLNNPKKAQKLPPSIDSISPYKIPSEASCQGYSPSLTYHQQQQQHRQQRTRSNSFTHRQLTASSAKPNVKKIGIPLLSPSPSVSNVCSLSSRDNNDTVKDQQQQRHNADDSSSKNAALQHHCTCNGDPSLTPSTEVSVSSTRCQHCTSSHSLQHDRKDSASDQTIVATPPINSDSNSAATPSPGNEETSLANIKREHNNISRSGATNYEQTTDDEETPPVDTADDTSLTPTTTSTTPKTTTSTPLLAGAAATETAAASLAVHITPSTPSSSSSMVHTMSTKFHFTRSATSITATSDRNKTMSRSSSSTSSSSSSASLLAAAVATPFGLLSNNNKDGSDGKSSSTRFVQSLLGRKTSLPSLFTSSKKDHSLPSSKNDT